MRKTALINAKTRITKEDWLAKAIAIMTAKGIAGVRVEVIARELGVSKGGFYWHFKDRQDLLNEMLAVWKNEATTWFLERLTDKFPDPLERLKTLWRVAHSPRNDKPGGRLELAIRAWAMDSDLAAKAVKSVDRERISFVQSLYEEIGFKPAEARIRAEVFYGYINGRHLSAVQGSAADLQTQFDFLITR